ncbi:hypothetical protein QJ856_gp0878 [Tupanvirus deep ocean]|uniref:Uncharacterized protein n=2 Tax=Tupanvirus TaxID=2094720 RepID=A0AC62A8C7_9VIRU|nr:hypothetical protein QJ856_gp0878 [Tupanvirus deep ocean]QKU33878.1 hypothetical protein [Tupanvirus deep ocean]
MHMKIYTIGHSNRPINAFIKILIENRIRCLVDVRSYPGSRTVPEGLLLSKYANAYLK